VYEPSELGDGVFIGPGAILTNDVYPRAVNADMTLKTQRDWSLEKVKILTGASIGAGSICVAPVKIGRWAIVAAGAVVIEDVKDFALVAGVPAKQIGWVGKSGYRLIEDKEHFWCPLTKEKFVIKNGILEELLTP
jgi:acetyltransferase-like isoleucine patch superfamily enzyme